MSDPRTEPSAAHPPVQPSSGAPTGVDVTSDEMLLLGARMRDANALGALFDRHGGLVYTLALRIVSERDLAEEVAQDAFLRCWHGLERYDAPRGTPSGWLLGITRRRALDLVHGRQGQEQPSEPEAMTEPGGRESSAASEAGEGESRATAPVDADDVGPEVREALAELPTAQRAAIELAYYGGLTQSEVAARLGEPIGRVKMRIRDGLRRLRRVLAPSVDAGPAPGRGAS